MEVKFLGHGCLEISVNNKYIIVDPFISGNPLNKTINLNSLNPDYIFITHALDFTPEIIHEEEPHGTIH